MSLQPGQPDSRDQEEDHHQAVPGGNMDHPSGLGLEEQQQEPEPKPDVGEEEEEDDDAADIFEAWTEQRIQVLPGASDTAASFELEGEDHTLGNALRWVIMKNPNVEFCGYSIPHPSEAKMNVRIQTYEGTTAFDALERGFDDLMDLCDVVVDKFTMARNQHRQRNSR